VIVLLLVVVLLLTLPYQVLENIDDVTGAAVCATTQSPKPLHLTRTMIPCAGRIRRTRRQNNEEIAEARDSIR
jgi:hypothetical protein